jgi:hypothetical protein
MKFIDCENEKVFAFFPFFLLLAMNIEVINLKLIKEHSCRLSMKETLQDPPSGW